jgi:uncharacterized protein with HEPN domain
LINADRVRLVHMLDAAREALSFAANRSRADLNHERMLLHSLVRSIEVIGEAAINVSPEYKTSSEIPWVKLAGMRNRLVHAYFDIDEDIVWDTTVLDLPPLIAELTKRTGEP